MADNLLDKASILLTPTAYNDGSMLSVKPENGDGDFTFSRSSAATRVNAQGLVENVQIISSELVSNGNFSQIGTEEVSNGNFSQEGSEIVTNGDFSNGSSNWVKSTNVYISTSSCNFDNTSDNTASCFIQQSGVLQSTKSYKVTINVSSYISGDLKIIGVTGSPSFEINQQGQYILFVNSTQSNLAITVAQSGVDCNLTIDNVSVKEVGQDWDLTNGATINNIGLNIDYNLGNGSTIQTNVFTIGKTYKVQVNVDDNSTGVARIGLGLSPVTLTNGLNTFYLEAVGTDIEIRNHVDFIGSITNISVKEVGQDWTFGTNTTISEENGSLKAMIDGANGLITQVSVVDANKKYRASFDLKYISGIGAIKFEIGGFDSGFIAANLGENNTYTYDFTTTNTGSLAFRSGGNAIEGYITNVSVKEITDDTDLPRINYEGFSYQDSLGIEEVVNGDFATDSNWSTPSGWEIIDGKLKGTNLSGVSATQVRDIFSNKSFKVVYTVSDYVQGDIRISLGGVQITPIRSADGTYTEYIDIISGNSSVYIQGINNFTGSIDNVSVKEVIGQEVVPDSGCGSWLLEPQSTNLITYSEDFSQWTDEGIRMNIVLNSHTAPNGEMSAASAIPPNGEVFGSINMPLAMVSGTTYTQSVYAKPNGQDFVRIRIGSLSAYFNVSEGTIGTTSAGLTTSITESNNGFYRCVITGQFDGSNNYMRIYSSATDGSISTGDGVNGVYIWGAQTEQQSYATSYIPTNGATNTRLQDIATNSGNSTLINSTEGVLYAEIAALADDLTNRFISLTDTTANNSVSLFYGGGSSNFIRCEIKSNNITQAELTTTNFQITNYNKVAIKYKENDFALWVNGTEVSTDTSGSVPIGLNDLSFDRANILNFYGKAKALAVYKEALTDAELQSLTTT